MKDLIRLARELDMPLVATNDLHYTSPEDAKAHSALLCVQSGSTLMDPNRFKFDADEFYLKTPGRDAAHRGASCPRPATTPCSSPRRCDVSFTEDEGRYMPRFPCPEGENEDELVHQGGRARPARALPRRHPRLRPQAGRVRDGRHRLARGTPGYFLVVADFINWAKKQRHPGRPGPWLGCRVDVRLRHGDHRPRPDPARPDLRAVPQPRAPLDARLRRRLRRAPAR